MLAQMTLVLDIGTSLISRVQRDIARAHSCQEWLYAVVQPLDGTKLSTMTNSRFLRGYYLRSGYRIKFDDQSSGYRTKRDPSTARERVKTRLAVAKPWPTRMGRQDGKGDTRIQPREGTGW